MLDVNCIFEKLKRIMDTEYQTKFVSRLLHCKMQQKNDEQTQESCFENLKTFLSNIFELIDELAVAIANDDTILISVKDQKLLQKCFQLITYFGISLCLIPGLGIPLKRRFSSAELFTSIPLNVIQKYEILVSCTDFFARSYEIPLLKKIIVTSHLSDYLAALIQLSFAPLKKPNTDGALSEEVYEKINKDRQKYICIYKHLVSNCFQPTLMKELLVLQGVSEKAMPKFAKKIINNELSYRLLSPGGLLSLIRCFIDGCSALEWKNVYMICKILTVKHGDVSEEDYLKNICLQLGQVLELKNTYYLATATACVLSLYEKFPNSPYVNTLLLEIFTIFDYNNLISKSCATGTILLDPKEINHKIQVLHACICTIMVDWPISLFKSSLFVIFLIGMNSSKHIENNTKLKEIISKSLEKLNKNELCEVIKYFLFGYDPPPSMSIFVEEYDAGTAIKAVASKVNHPKEEALLYFVNLFKLALDDSLIRNIFEVSLEILMNLTTKRNNNQKQKNKIIENDEVILLDETDEQYAIILQLLSEISASPKVITCLKTEPLIVLPFIEHFLIRNNQKSYEECITIALVLLNTVLSSSTTQLKEGEFRPLIPVLKNMSNDKLNLNHILSKEALSLITSEVPKLTDTAYSKAVSDVYDNLLPVRAHGIINLTKLIDALDPETISKKHFLFCLFQEQLKESDSYIYLSAINGIASLGTHCTDDVLNVLCKEFLELSTNQTNIVTEDSRNRISELRMKIGDVIVKVTKRLGEMAVVHKTILLNTMLCGCRDEDPLIRTSALSNLAELALVLHYKIGSIVYEVLLCLWGVIESDKAIECRRAAVMVISSLIKGLGKDTLIELKENLLPIYRTLKNLYNDHNEDSVLRLHAQIALEELNDVVHQFLFPEVKLERQIFVLDKPNTVFK